MTRSRSITFLAGAALATPTVADAALEVLAVDAELAAGRDAVGAAPPHAATARALSDINSGLGPIIVDSEGRTLYLWQADTGPNSTCSGACAAAWPPLLTSRAPTAGRGAKASLLGTATRSDGADQVTYNQHPLYLFAGDSASGETTGEGSTGFGARWYVLSPGGNQITGAASTSSPGSGSSSPSGY